MNNLGETIQQQFQIWYQQSLLHLPKILIGIGFLLFFIFMSSWVKKWVYRLLDTKSDDPILTQFLSSISRIIMILIGVLSCLQIVGLGKLVTSILATAGISAFIIGFAFKDIGENFLAGMMMAFNRPFKLGDMIQVNNFKGRIVKLNFRDTQIKSADGTDVYIPNSVMLKNPLLNFTVDGFMRHDFILKIAQTENVDAAIEIIIASLKKIDGILLDDRPPTVGIKNISGKQYELDVHYWRDNFTSSIPHHEARTKVLKNVLNTLREAEIVVS